MNEGLTLIIGIVGAVLGAGGIGAVITAIVSRHKMKADAHKTGAETVNEQILSLTTIISQLRTQNENLDKQNAEIGLRNQETQEVIREIRDLIRECKNFSECPVKVKEKAGLKEKKDE